jgi:ATP-dependent helicase/nuclease subunit A
MTQSAATSAQMSAWVNANAGSGKTYVLISRLVSLMLSGASPDKLLCLTYTKSAAAEMQNRLFSLLSEWAVMDDVALREAVEARIGVAIDQPEDLYRARTLFARALEAPGGLKVQTIHAFCEALLHRFPLEAGLTPGFDLIDETDASSLVNNLAAQIMARDDADFIFLSRQFPEQAFTGLVHRMVASRSRYKNLTGEALETYLTENFGPEARDHNDTARAQLSATMTAWAPRYQDVALAEGSANDQKTARKLASALSDTDLSDPWDGLRAFFETDKGEPRARLYTKVLAEAAPDLVQEIDQHGQGFYELEAQRRRQFIRYVTGAFHRAAAILQQDYATAKAMRNCLDYDDLIGYAAALLSNRSATAWVLYKIDNGLDHILIDEAQDTSPTQWQVIAALAEEFFAGASARKVTRTIFAVGDEKQSIFSFQGADPSSFDKMRDFFAARVRASALGFEPVDMIKSYRSAPDILGLVDRLFATPERAQGLTAAGQATQHIAHRSAATGFIELWRPETNSEKAPEDIWWRTDLVEATARPARQRMADRVADKIQNLLQSSNAAVTAGDILILVRRRNAVFFDLLRALHQTGVAIAGADRMKLLDELIIKDLINLVELALNPMNDLALAIFLRGPLGGLSDEALYQLAYGRPGSLYDALAADRDQPVFASAYADVSWLINHAALTPFDFFARYLSGHDAQRRLKSRLGNEIDDAVNEFLRLALNFERTHAATLQGFMHWIRSHATEIKREMEEGADAVRIMTVHGAKGLEAPIVFLIDDCVPQGLSTRDQLIFVDQHLIWRPPSKERPREPDPRLQAAEAQAFAESQRLLYVALTRAKDRLYIASYMARGETPAENSWYGQLAACHPDTGDSDRVWSLGDEARAVPERSSDSSAITILPRVGPDWIRQKVAATADGLSSSATRLARRHGLVKSTGAARGTQFGTLVHNILQFLPTIAATDRYARLETYLEDHATIMLPAQRKALIAQVRQVMECDDFAPLFSPQARAECPIRGVITDTDGREITISGQVDRFYHDRETNFIWVVDFKTGKRDTSDDSYLRQMAIYRHLIRQATGVSNVRCSLIWVNGAEEERFMPQALDQAFTEIVSAPLDRAPDAT